MMLTRRRLLLSTAVVGGGVLLGYAATRPSRHRRANDSLAAAGQHYVTSWLRIDPDNRVSVYIPHAEMGQGVHTALAMMAADELDADWELVNVEQAPATDLFANGELVKGFATEFGLPGFLQGLVNVSAFKVAEVANLQITGGSSSVRFTGEHGMRTAGAAAREMLLQCAAARWDVPDSECYTSLSHVHHDASGRSAAYGDLAADAALLEPPASPVLKQPSQFTLMGKPISRRDIPAKVDGTAPYGLDAHLPGMLYAAVTTAPVFGSRVVSVDAADALQRRGVHRIVQLEDAVAVVADNYWRASEALKRIQVVFEQTDNDNVSSESIFAQYDRDLDSGSSKEDVEAGDTQAAMAAAVDIIEADYRVPFLAHAAMEPMNCTVHFHDGKAEVWTGTQDFLGTRGRVASLGDLNEEDVTVHFCYVGGGFGRRLPNTTNTIDQATLIAKEFDVPVKTVWSREDDMQHDYYRPAVTSRFRAGFDGAGHVTAWENRYIGQNTPPEAAHIPYAIPNQSIRYVDSDTHIPFGAWRSVAHSQHTFFLESFVDELAHRAGMNPFQYRMELLAEKPRYRKVLEVAADAAGWGRNVAEGRAMGIALQQSFGSIVAQIAEVSVASNGSLRVHKVTCAIDCGRAINPDTVASQVESGIIFGLTAALYGEITIADGRVQQGNFPDYEMVRLSDSPEIDVHIVESGETLGGLGEPATPPVAAAVGNAAYILTGRRIRELPFKNYDFTLPDILA
ncbi:MAG: xanthine dehydrogenase family protein molybdopterin-binding subunit [Pseudohongiellaceae bacterium]